MDTMQEQDRFNRIRPYAGLLIGVALVIALAVAAMVWLGGRAQGVLYTDLRQEDAAEIVARLDEWKVPHRIEDDGRTLTVPQAQVHALRMRLVSEGVPSGGRVGLELFRESDFGVTEFAQRVNLQRALQGELERTILALSEVRQARVHLTMRRSGGLLRERDPSKASVQVSLNPGARLSASQVQGIRLLVASAVDGLRAEGVVVVDERGVPLAHEGSALAAVEPSGRAEAQLQLEQRIHDRVRAVLDPLFVEGDYGLSVDVTLNYDQVRQTSERPLATGSDGNGLVLRRRTDARDAGTARGDAAVPAVVETEYLLGRATEEVVVTPGRVERISVAVVIPGALDTRRAAELRTVVAAAAGLMEVRGDTVAIMAGAATSAPVQTEEVVAPIAAVIPDRTDLALNHEAEGGVPADTEPNALGVAVDDTVPGPLGFPVPWLVGALGVGALAGLLVGLPVRRRRLTVREREKALAHVRAWLAQDAESMT